MLVSTSNIVKGELVGVFTSPHNLMCCLYKKPCLLFIQFGHCDVLFRRPVFREWVAAFVGVMEVIYHRLVEWMSCRFIYLGVEYHYIGYVPWRLRGVLQ